MTLISDSGTTTSWWYHNYDKRIVIIGYRPFYLAVSVRKYRHNNNINTIPSISYILIWTHWKYNYSSRLYISVTNYIFVALYDLFYECIDFNTIWYINLLGGFFWFYVVWCYGKINNWDCNIDWLWVRSLLEQMNYLFPFIFSFLSSGVEKRGIEFRHSNLTQCRKYKNRLNVYRTRHQGIRTNIRIVGQREVLKVDKLKFADSIIFFFTKFL